MKAIIDVGPQDRIFDLAKQQLASKGLIDYRLQFRTARQLFAELTPARIDLLESLRRQGSCSVNALAKAANRNYSNVHSDIAALESLGLVKRDEDDAVCVPFDSVEIRVTLADAA